MTDEEFLSYCHTHAETPRCGFIPEQIARLCRLAGLDKAAAEWAALPNAVHDMNRADVQRTVAIARKRLGAAS